MDLPRAPHRVHRLTTVFRHQMRFATLVPFFSLLVPAFADSEASPSPEVPNIFEALHGHHNFPRAETKSIVRMSVGSGLSSEHHQHLRPQRRIICAPRCQICGQPCQLSEQGYRWCPRHLERGETCVADELNSLSLHHLPRAETTSFTRDSVRSELRSKHDQDVRLAKRLTPIRWCRICRRRCGVYLTTMVCPVHYKEMGNTCVEARHLHPRLSLDAPAIPLNDIAEPRANGDRDVGLEKRLTPERRCNVCNRKCICVIGPMGSGVCAVHGNTCTVINSALDHTKGATHPSEPPKGVLAKRLTLVPRCTICNRQCLVRFHGHFIHCPIHGNTCAVNNNTLDYTNSPSHELPALKSDNHRLNHSEDAIDLAERRRDGLAKRLTPVPKCLVDGCGRTCRGGPFVFFCPMHFALGSTCS